jgi:hypothetical protein
MDGSAVLIRYTFAGDSDLDHQIDADDFFNIDAGISAGTPTWFYGDFNYSGSIDADDYFAIDSSYNKNSIPLTSPPLLPPELSAPLAYHRPAEDVLI